MVLASRSFAASTDCVRHFFYWKKRLLDDAETPQFVAVKVAPDEASVIETKEPVATIMHGQAIEVRLCSGRSLLVEPGFDVVHLRQLLSALEA